MPGSSLQPRPRPVPAPARGNARVACGPAAARAADSSPLTRHTREMAATERLRVPGPLSPAAGRVGRVRARAPARCAWRTQRHPSPWPFSASPKARDKAHEPRAAARASLIRKKTGTLPPAPPHGLPALRQHARTAPGARALWRTAPGRFATPRTLGKALAQLPCSGAHSPGKLCREYPTITLHSTQ